MERIIKRQEMAGEAIAANVDYPLGAVVVALDEYRLKVTPTQSHDNRCSNCFFNHNTDGSCFEVRCLPYERSDNEDVIYKKIDL